MDEGATPPDPQLLAVIARKLATDSLALAEILKHYNLTQAYYDQHIAENGYFKKLLEAYTAEWESVGNTKNRLAFHAQTALEQELPVLQARMGDPRSQLGDAVAAAKLFKEIAGIAPPAPGSGQIAERFTISINLGGAQPVTIETKTEEPPLLEPPNE
jgi:hypothetical protein